MSAENKPDVIEITQFDNVSNLLQYLDAKISELRTQLGDYLRKLENMKVKAETMLKFESLLGELAKGAGGASTSGKELELGQVKVLINPSPKQELELMIDVVRSLQDRIVTLEKIRKNIEPLSKLSDIDLSLEVIFRNSIPSQIIIRM
ncbi:MAG: hypothetical protein F7C32_04065 [Desulfurococcales archaeon]|nr:hypothetical protein [Desulfurococcales archaeon]